jgi:hypothetical protein
LAERFYFASFDVLRLSGLKMSDEVEEILDGDDVVRSLIEEVRRQKCLYSKSYFTGLSWYWRIAAKRRRSTSESSRTRPTISRHFLQ